MARANVRLVVGNGQQGPAPWPIPPNNGGGVPIGRGRVRSVSEGEGARLQHHVVHASYNGLHGIADITRALCKYDA